MPAFCVVPQCSTRASGHRFPSDVARKKAWLHKIRRPNYAPSIHARVCKKHFVESDYEMPFESFTEKPRLKLKNSAVPSVFPWTNPQSDSAKPVHRRLPDNNATIYPYARINGTTVEIVKPELFSTKKIANEVEERPKEVSTQNKLQCDTNKVVQCGTIVKGQTDTKQVVQSDTKTRGVVQCNTKPAVQSDSTAVQSDTKPVTVCDTSVIVWSDTLPVVTCDTSVIIRSDTKVEVQPDTGEVTQCHTKPVVKCDASVRVQSDTKPVVRHDTKQIVQCDTMSAVLYNTKPVVRHDTKQILQRDTNPVVQYNTKPAVRHDTKQIVQCDTMSAVQYNTKPVVRHDTKQILQRDTNPVVQYNTSAVKCNFSTNRNFNHPNLSHRDIVETRVSHGIFGDILDNTDFYGITENDKQVTKDSDSGRTTDGQYG